MEHPGEVARYEELGDIYLTATMIEEKNFLAQADQAYADAIKPGGAAPGFPSRAGNPP